jgi:hypothetical protein
VKSESVVQRRVQRLRDRYLRRHVLLSQERRHRNCVHNQEHAPSKLPYSRSELSTELDLAPRKVTTLLVIKDDQPVRICTLGLCAGNSTAGSVGWDRDVCDSDSISATCGMFKARTGADEAYDEFMELLKDDKFVYENYRDLAALQWVLEDRRPRLPWYRRLFAWLFGKPTIALGLLPPGASDRESQELEDLWR